MTVPGRNWTLFSCEFRPHLKGCSAELQLRAGLIPPAWVHGYLISLHVCSKYEVRPHTPAASSDVATNITAAPCTVSMHPPTVLPGYLLEASSFKLTLELASFPGSCVDGERRAWRTHLHMLSSPVISVWEFGKSVHYTKLLEICWLFPCGQWWRSDEGNMLFVYRNYPCVHSFQVMLWHVTDEIFHQLSWTNRCRQLQGSR